MSIFKWLFPGRTVSSPAAVDGGVVDDGAVLVCIEAAMLRGTADDIDDLATFEDALQEALGDEGEVDGHDIGATDATVYCYGRNPDRMFERMRPVLENSSLARTAVVTLRYGGPDSSNLRHVQMGR